MSYSAVNKKPLKSPDTLLHQALQLRNVSRNNTTIKSNINPTFPFRSLDLLVQVCYRSRRRYRIEWHVHDRSNTTKSSGLSAGVEAFPFCPTRLIKMDMGINETWKEDTRSVVYIRGPRRKGGTRKDSMSNRHYFSGVWRYGYRGWGQDTRDYSSRRGYHCYR